MIELSLSSCLASQRSRYPTRLPSRQPTVAVGHTVRCSVAGKSMWRLAFEELPCLPGAHLAQQSALELMLGMVAEVTTV
jgi:hypothetical protein